MKLYCEDLEYLFMMLKAQKQPVTELCISITKPPDFCFKQTVINLTPLMIPDHRETMLFFTLFYVEV